MQAPKNPEQKNNSPDDDAAKLPSEEPENSVESENDESGDVEGEPVTAHPRKRRKIWVGERKFKVLERVKEDGSVEVVKKRRKTRSRQKNIRKDTRSEELKPSYLTKGAADYQKQRRKFFHKEQAPSRPPHASKARSDAAVHEET